MTLKDNGFAPFQMFDFLPTGLAVLAAGILYFLLLDRHLLPVGGSDPIDEHPLHDYLIEVLIPRGSPLAGQAVARLNLRHRNGLTILRVMRDHDGEALPLVPAPHLVLWEGDRLVKGDLKELPRTKNGGRWKCTRNICWPATNQPQMDRPW